jgi:hypothetical protein
MYAALWRAVAAADRRSACALASASFFAQSGLTRSVVITVGADADKEVVRLLPCGTASVRVDASGDGLLVGAGLLTGPEYTRPLRKDGDW